MAIEQTYTGVISVTNEEVSVGPYSMEPYGDFDMEQGLQIMLGIQEQIDYLSHLHDSIEKMIVHDLQEDGGFRSDTIKAEAKLKRSSIDNKSAVEEWVSLNPALMSEYAKALSDNTSISVRWAGVVKDVGVPRKVIEEHTTCGDLRISITRKNHQKGQ